MAEKEYIERETLKILFAGACAECRDSCAEFDGIEADCNQCLLYGVIKDAKSIPAADARLVVLCKDCCMYECHEYDGGLKHVCELFKRQMQEADFCSYGEKREES